jgi:hypothetical protein
MARFASGIFTPKNPDKYIGKGTIKYRSSWELMFFMFLDNNPSVLKWASESITIPYRNPLTGKQTIYIPDIFMVYVNKTGKQISEVVEIKPSKQTSLMEARTAHDKAHAVINMAKWQQAQAWCSRNGINFRVVTEQQLFHSGKK